MQTDRHGCSTCPPGQERYEEYYSAIAQGRRVQYDYRTPDGRLFSTVAKTVEIARRRRDAWLATDRNGHNPNARHQYACRNLHVWTDDVGGSWCPTCGNPSA